MKEISDFLNINQLHLEYVITTIIYLTFLIIALKSGANWVTFLIAYMVISAILRFLELRSFLNIIDLVVNFFKDLWNGINPFQKIKDLFDWKILPF